MMIYGWGKIPMKKHIEFCLKKPFKTALTKGQIQKEDVQFLIAGDLINQITPTSFAARTNADSLFRSFWCMFYINGRTCAWLLLSSIIKEQNIVLTGASSHNAAVERQFRYPTEYGGQKPPTAQWTVTGAGVALACSK